MSSRRISEATFDKAFIENFKKEFDKLLLFLHRDNSIKQ